jgi:NAD(P)-dependent dehydrogenase (short-subunit alcohol dehydrogenase family)
MTNILEAISFGATSTTEDVLSGVNLKGKRILVTGVSAGIGVETARSLAAYGAEVVGAARDLNKAKTATEQVRQDALTNGGSFELVELDLANLNSVRACADRLLAKGGAFDVIIANAGVMATPFGHTADGFETQFGTNPNFERTPYDPFVAYGRSKTANILFAVAFDKRHRERGVRAAAVHPGVIETELIRYMSPSWLQNRVDEINQQLASAGKPPLHWKSIPQGAATSVWAAVVASGDEIGGRYCEDCHVGSIVPEEVPASAVTEGVRGYAVDAKTAEALWKKSEEMVGESF